MFSLYDMDRCRSAECVRGLVKRKKKRIRCITYQVVDKTVADCERDCYPCPPPPLRFSPPRMFLWCVPKRWPTRPAFLPQGANMCGLYIFASHAVSAVRLTCPPKRSHDMFRSVTTDLTSILVYGPDANADRVSEARFHAFIGTLHLEG